jgi:hypothetical protein
MSLQPDLFQVESPAGHYRAPESLARRSDPETSHEAAREIVASGTDAAQCERVLEALRRYPNHTSADLAKLSGIDRYVTARRLSELQASGRARTGGKTLSHSTGKSGMAWWPV